VSPSLPALSPVTLHEALGPPLAGFLADGNGDGEDEYERQGPDRLLWPEQRYLEGLPGEREEPVISRRDMPLQQIEEEVYSRACHQVSEDPWPEPGFEEESDQVGGQGDTDRGVEGVYEPVRGFPEYHRHPAQNIRKGQTNEEYRPQSPRPGRETSCQKVRGQVWHYRLSSNLSLRMFRPKLRAKRTNRARSAAAETISFAVSYR